MKRFKFLLTAFFLFLANPVYGDDSTPPPIGLSKGSQPGGLKIGEKGAGELLQTILQNTIIIFFSVGAIGFIIMFLWGAVDWILSGGDKEKVAEARKRIVTAITGLVLLSLSFVIIVVLGQVLSIDALQYGQIKIPSLLKPNQ